MALTFSREPLSAAPTGIPFPVSATGTPGNTIHICTSSLVGYDEIYVWVSNISAAKATLSILFGNGFLCKDVSIPANSPPIPIITGQGSRNGLPVTAYSNTANVLNLFGFVNRAI